MSATNEYSSPTEGLQAEPVAALAAPSRMERALAHAREGWHVFPCHWVLPNGSCSCGKPDCTRKGKHPLTEHGFKDASTDPVKIMGWWSRWPDANIGGRAGAASGRDVLDVDPRHGGDASLAELEAENGALPTTLVAKTG